jgi:hypothetical protein
MHAGDICNLGIACPPNASDRNLADFISEALDEKGCAHINFADDLTANQVSTADQVGGNCVRAAAVVQPAPSPTPVPLPRTSTGGRPIGALSLGLLGAGLVLAGLALWPRRRRADR